MHLITIILLIVEVVLMVFTSRKLLIALTEDNYKVLNAFFFYSLSLFSICLTIYLSLG
ncbi:hypothetical protein FLAN108750_14190 [Flavobacterium antarcticum]